MNVTDHLSTRLLKSIKGGFIVLMLGTLLFIAASGMSSSITISQTTLPTSFQASAQF